MSDYYYDENQERLDSARKHLNQAIEELSRIILHEDPGFNDDVLERIEESVLRLLKERRKLP